jgi:hypothetical protein
MPTTRFCSLIGVPEQTWRRHQARTRRARPVKGPWPMPEPASYPRRRRRHALAHPAWGHRKVWAMCRHDGLPVSAATVLRLLREEGPLLEASYQRERRQLAAGGGRHLATRRLPGLLEQVRAGLARLVDGQPARRHRRGRARSDRGRMARRRSTDRPGPARRRRQPRGAGDDRDLAAAGGSLDAVASVNHLARHAGLAPAMLRHTPNICAAITSCVIPTRRQEPGEPRKPISSLLPCRLAD